jgi:hypothetical protein
MKLDVYFNLHKKKLSLRSRERHNYGRVIDYADSIILKNCTFPVSEAGRQRVLKEKRKNVHAYVRGETPEEGGSLINPRSVKYNPYKYDSFVFSDTEEPVHSADYVVIIGKEITAYNPK